jgi:hypothetical protein
MYNFFRNTRSLALLILLAMVPFFSNAQTEIEEEELPPQEELYAEPDQGTVEAEDESDDILKFREIDASTATPVTVRRAPAGRVNELKEEEDFWYVNAAREKAAEETPSSSRRSGGGGISETVVWVLIITAFIVILVLFLSNANVSLMRKKPMEVPSDGQPHDEFMEDVLNMDHDREIRKAVEQGDFRKAIRFHYLQTLKQLSQKDLIQFRQERTDSDYVHQLYNTNYYKGFSRLTRHFQYAWYGKFSIKPELYGMIESEFSTFKKGLKA